jgi:hypothetical protein
VHTRDGRKEKRSPKDSQVFLAIGAQPMFPGLASAENATPCGARLLAERPCEPDTPVVIKFPQSEWVQARVVYCHRVPGKSFAIGIEFLRRQPI